MRCPTVSCSARPPRRILLDTDMGNDVDDALALGLLHALESLGACRLLGVTVSKPNASAADFTRRLNAFYGRGDRPVAQIAASAALPRIDPFAGPLCAMQHKGQPLFPAVEIGEVDETPVALLRKQLAESLAPVTVVSIGFLSNLAALLASPGDRFSPLNGGALVAAKVERLVFMGGDFRPEVLAVPDPKWAEWNIVHDIPAAQRVVADWPGEVVFLGYELGMAVCYPAESIERDYGWVEHHPVAMAYRLFAPMPHDRPCWDPLAALYAVWPESSDFGLSEPGRVTVDATGYCGFAPQPAGRHRYLTASVEQQERLRTALISLCARPVDTVMAAV